MKRKMLFMFLFVFSWFAAIAQEFSAKGEVKDEKGLLLPGVSVIVKGTTRGTETDFNGQFSLNVQKGETLVFSYVGMKSQELKPQGKPISITLMEDAQEIEEVVIVAYGTAKKESLVGAQSTVSAKELAARPITNVTSALAGNSPGIQTSLSSGQPGESLGIRVRGFGSINAGADPIYVVDGTIFNGDIANISVQDIQSISVLKDAASTALYGSSAGNGVVLITTKSGIKSENSKPTINYSNQLGFSQRGQQEYDVVGTMDYYPLRWQQWFNEYHYRMGIPREQAVAQANNDIYYNYTALNERGERVYQPYAGIKSQYVFDDATQSWQLSPNAVSGGVPAIVMADGKLNPEITGLLYGDDLDWKKHLFTTGVRNEHNLNISHASEQLKSYFSVGYLKDNGYRIETSFERFSGRANLDYEVNKWLSVGTNLSFAKSNWKSPSRLGSFNANTFLFVNTAAPIFPVHQHHADGSYVLGPNGEKSYDYLRARPFTGFFNPVYQSKIDLLQNDRIALNTRNFAEIRFLPELKFRLNYAYDLLDGTRKHRYNNIMGDQPQGLLSMRNQRSHTTTFNQLLDYNKEFGSHTIGALLGHESYSFNTASNTQIKSRASFSEVDEMGNYLDMSEMSSISDNYRKEGYFGRLTYNYDSKYDASLSYRRDASSRFAPDYRWGNFWSVGAGWHLKKEAFLENVDWLNSLKLRASYGVTGNDDILEVGVDDPGASYYPYYTLYVTSPNDDALGLTISSVGVGNLLWEKQHSTDIALEFGVFDFLRASVEWYSKVSTDLIFGYPVAASTGMSLEPRNIGKVRNTGLEVSLTADVVKRDDFTWSVNVNGTTLSNKLLGLPEQNRKTGIIRGPLGNYKLMEGHSIYEYYLPLWAGVNPQTGIAMYVLDKETYPNAETVDGYPNYTTDYNFAKRDFVGSSIPDVQGGFGTNVTWKNFDFGLQFAYQLGGKVYDYMYMALMSNSVNTATAAHTDLKKAWKAPGDVTDVPALDSSTYGLYSASMSDRFLISGSSLMLRNISLGYSLPSAVLSKVGISNLRFGLSAENLFLWSKRKGLNPLENFSGTSMGQDYGYSKVVTFGVNVSF